MRDRRLRHELQDLGANAFLFKPLPPDELIQTLRRFVDLHERNMELT
jgi:hypothetical protein